ncbi:hypothetical protein JCM11491_003264 [Sporobolomyces phaffii]
MWPTKLARLGISRGKRFSSSVASRAYPGLYLHPNPDSTSYALSFLRDPAPNAAFSPTTIGHLRVKRDPHEGEGEGEPEILPRYFTENPHFLDLVHDVLEQNVHTDVWVESLAKSIVKTGTDTYIHLGDQRNPAEAQRTAQPQDILASVLVRGETGRVEPASYERNRVAYRVVSELGLMRLPPTLFDRVVEACERVREVEHEIARDAANAHR